MWNVADPSEEVVLCAGFHRGPPSFGNTFEQPVHDRTDAAEDHRTIRRRIPPTRLPSRPIESCQLVFKGQGGSGPPFSNSKNSDPAAAGSGGEPIRSCQLARGHTPATLQPVPNTWSPHTTSSSGTGRCRLTFQIRTPCEANWMPRKHASQHPLARRRGVFHVDSSK